MEKFKGFVTRHRKGLIILLVLAVLGGAATWLVVTSVAREQEVLAQLSAGATDVTILTKTTLEKSVTATGLLQSTESRKVAAELNARVLEIYVEVGDTVQAGDPLCRLDSADIERSIAYTKDTIENSEKVDSAQTAQARHRLTQAEDQYYIDKLNHELSVYNAQIDLDKAKQKLADVDKEWGSVNRAEKAVSNARTTASNARSAANTARANYEAAVAAGTATSAELAELQKTVASAESAAQSAESQITTLENNVEAAEEAAEKAYKQELESRENAVTSAQKAYDTAVKTMNTTLYQDELSVDAARDSLRLQNANDPTLAGQNSLANYEENLKKATVYAPVSGVVTQVGAEVGQLPAGVLFLIEDLQSLEVPANVAEYDAVGLRVGLPAKISSDALSGENWTGKVSKISPRAVDTAGNFTVTVELSGPAGKLAIGMSAKMHIVSESKEGVFAVPFDAVTTNEQGQKVVYTMEPVAAEGAQGSGAPREANQARQQTQRREIVVETGMETDYYIEIISPELREGLPILNDPEGRNLVDNPFADLSGGMSGPTVASGPSGAQGAVRMGG
ncbi:MAG: efflux RND transporter periplasmic adaptor subunit [Christensenellaceae bacterium]|jgi:RND family efflux transporter MFP subunit|nr:efflux RND transporter periplasmic adaptor subunit [Christensenellaceae bacterium]